MSKVEGESERVEMEKSDIRTRSACKSSRAGDCNGVSLYIIKRALISVRIDVDRLLVLLLSLSLYL